MFNKQLFDNYSKGYAENIEHRDEHHFLPWECLQNFKEHWDIEAIDFKSMYDRSFQSKMSVRLWKRDGYFPKEIMLEFIELDKEFARSMFRDLFDESKEIDGRVNRFVFHCKIFLGEVKKRKQLADAHYHDDLFMPSLYLAFNYPNDYTTYSYGLFRGFMEKLGARKIPQVDDVERYFKVMRIVQKFLMEDEALLEKLITKLEPREFYSQPTMFLAQDFEHYVLSCKD